MGSVADGGFVFSGDFSAGASFSEPMTNAQFTNFGHLAIESEPTDAGAMMSGGNFVNQTNFLGISR
jgi:hypothetical protein